MPRAMDPSSRPGAGANQDLLPVKGLQGDPEDGERPVLGDAADARGNPLFLLALPHQPTLGGQQDRSAQISPLRLAKAQHTMSLRNRRNPHHPTDKVWGRSSRTWCTDSTRCHRDRRDAHHRREDPSGHRQRQRQAGLYPSRLGAGDRRVTQRHR